MPTDHRDMPIFFDKTGKRWERTKSTLLVAVFVVVAALLTAIPKVLSNVRVSPFVLDDIPALSAATDIKQTPQQIAYGIDRKDMPVLGSGPLLRVIKIQGEGTDKAALDPFNDKPLRALTAQQAAAVDGHQYAIERYGQTEGKRIVLTFDDGPDPEYTPRVLDLLSREQAPSTFFVLGSAMTKFPDVANRLVREGHMVANHTFSHADFDFVSEGRAEQEINQTQRIIRAATQRNPAYFRIPYGGNDDDSVRDTMRGILQAQKLGYTVTSYHFDSNDWKRDSGDEFTFPELDGEDIVMLLHDAGGERTYSIEYLEAFIPRAKAAGYTFTTLEGLYPQSPSLYPEVTPGLADKTSLITSKAVLVWPQVAIRWLFVVTVGLGLFWTIFKIVLAGLFVFRTRYPFRNKRYRPFVSVIVPAYNEELVLTRTVASLLQSRYRNFEIIIVDDGSTDGTWEVIERLRCKKRVIGVRQVNGGKSSAVNHAIRLSKGEIVVSIDADTIFTPRTLEKLVRHFVHPWVGAVAGVVKVGNVRNYLTRWQALEYITGITIERLAQAYLGAIMIAPGACAAWRKNAVIAAGGYSDTTLAEDCDLSVAIQKCGYTIIQESEAVAYTEAPLTIRTLTKQRFRWMFGNIQVFWKHRDIILRPSRGWLGMFVMPVAVISVIMPLIFTPLLVIIGLENIANGRVLLLVLYGLAGIVMQFISAVIGLKFAKERYSHLLALPVFRIVYSPIKTYLLYASIVTFLKGAHVGWNKFARTNTVNYGNTSMDHVGTVPATMKLSEVRATIVD